MSSCLCKNSEDAISPPLIEAVEDREDDSVHTLDVHEANHRPRPSPHFLKTSLDYVRGPEGAPQVLGKTVKAGNAEFAPLKLCGR
jgi:hypothetical protein